MNNPTLLVHRYERRCRFHVKFDPEGRPVAASTSSSERLESRARRQPAGATRPPDSGLEMLLRFLDVLRRVV